MKEVVKEIEAMKEKKIDYEMERVVGENDDRKI